MSDSPPPLLTAPLGQSPDLTKRRQRDDAMDRAQRINGHQMIDWECSGILTLKSACARCGRSMQQNTHGSNMPWKVTGKALTKPCPDSPQGQAIAALKAREAGAVPWTRREYAERAGLTVMMCGAISLFFAFTFYNPWLLVVPFVYLIILRIAASLVLFPREAGPAQAYIEEGKDV